MQGLSVKNLLLTNRLKVLLIIVAFNLCWLWFVQPIITTLVTGFSYLPLGREGVEKLLESVNFIKNNLFTGFLSVPYFSLEACIGYIALIVVNIFLFKGIVMPGPISNDIADSQPPAAGNNEYGNTQWLRSLREIKKGTELSVISANALDDVKPGFYLGCFNEKLIIQQYSGHLLLLAATRGGKTRRILFILIYVLLKSGASLVIFDPKGELYGITAEAAEKLGIRQNRINYSIPATSNRINPLYHVIDLYQKKDEEGYRVSSLINRIEKLKAAVIKNPNDTEKIKDIQRLELKLSKRISEAEHEVNRIIDFLVKRDDKKESSGSSFFINGASELLKLGIHYVCCVDYIPYKARTLERVSALLNEFCQPVSLSPKNPKETRWFAPLIEEIQKMYSKYPCYKAMQKISSTSKNYVSDFITTATQYLSLYSSYEIAQMMCDTDFKYEDLTKEQTVTYINTSLAESTYKDIALFYIENLYSSLMRKAEKQGNKLERKLFIIAEELTQLPPIPDLASKLNACASYGIQWVLVAQSINLMFDKYGRDSTLNILENCGTQVFLGSNSPESAQYVSSKFGTYTIEEKTNSISKAPASFTSNSINEGTRLLKRERITSGEAQQWNPNQGVIVATKGNNPAIIPAPQAEETLFKDIIGLGSEEWETKKIASWSTKPAHSKEELLSDWSIELNSNVKAHTVYSDKDRKKLRDEYLQKLFAASKNRQALTSNKNESKDINEKGEKNKKIESDSKRNQLSSPRPVKSF